MPSETPPSPSPSNDEALLSDYASMLESQVGHKVDLSHLSVTDRIKTLKALIPQVQKPEGQPPVGPQPETKHTRPSYLEQSLHNELPIQKSLKARAKSYTVTIFLTE